MKQSEAKILLFLETADDRFKYATQISAKLKMDYAYTLRILKSLRTYKYVKTINREQKVFYKLTFRAPMKKAREVMK